MNHSPSRILLLVENLLAKGVSVQLVHDNFDMDVSGYVVLSTEDGRCAIYTTTDRVQRVRVPSSEFCLVSIAYGSG